MKSKTVDIDRNITNILANANIEPCYHITYVSSSFRLRSEKIKKLEQACPENIEILRIKAIDKSNLKKRTKWTWNMICCNQMCVTNVCVISCATIFHYQKTRGSIVVKKLNDANVETPITVKELSQNAFICIVWCQFQMFVSLHME